MGFKITVIVEDYSPSQANGQDDGFRLQSPISSERLPGEEILVRQDQGLNKNDVSFRNPDQLVKLNSGPKTAYAHGILLRSHRRQEYRRGDPIWLLNPTVKHNDRLVQNRYETSAVNLRTSKRITIALDDVCWVPMFRKLDCDEGDEELLTISGALVKKPDTKMYFLVVVQRLHVRNNTVKVERAVMRENVEQDIWKYQNLTNSPDGERKIGELFQRTLASLCPDTLSGVDTDEESTSQSSSEGPHTGSTPERATNWSPSSTADISEEATLRLNVDFRVDLSVVDGEDDPHTRELTLALERKVMGKWATKPGPLIPEPPQGICNLGKKCPTPPKVFFVMNRPSIENPYPKHHHLEDHRCRIGHDHELHCIFQFRRGIVDRRSCIVPPSVRHTCCDTNAWPSNRGIAPPANAVEVRGGMVVQRGGRGGFEVVGEREDDYTDLPVKVEVMGFVPGRDLDELGRRCFGYGEQIDMIEKAGIPRGEEWLNGMYCDGHRGGGTCCPPQPPGTRQQQQWPPGCEMGVPGPSVSSVAHGHSPRAVQAGHHALGTASKPIELDDSDGNSDDEHENEREHEEEEQDAFGDRHFHGDEDSDEDDGYFLDIGGDMARDE